MFDRRRMVGYFSVMSVVGHGIDLIECARIAKVFTSHGQRFLDRILTRAEQQRMSAFKDPVPFIAGRFAAKEAILKVVGTGWRGQIAWTDMEILPDALGRPVATLSGETARQAEGLGIRRILLSITHTGSLAAASATGLSE
jgi:holo-[acyl-carrier protein] synthase